MNDLFTDLAPSSPPPLEAARRRLDALIAKRNGMLSEVEADGFKTPLEQFPGWARLQLAIRDEERAIRRLEESQAHGKAGA